ncbi:MAG: hypothetical protein KAH97_05490 [Anaerolineales bacterium]|nr:hypothetical protein [Anaerolineales bacterium]
MPVRCSRGAIKELFRHIPVHTFSLAAYPIVGLLAFNIDQIYAQGALKPLLISLSITAIILCGLRLLSRSWQLAGLLTSLLVLWFFLYGRFYIPWNSISVFGLESGRHRYFLVVWSGIILAAALWLIKRSRIYPDLTVALNIFSTILILLPTIQISAFLLRNLTPSRNPEVNSVTPLISWTDDSIPPDIYYIVLDGYARSDVLEQVYGIDNTSFLGDLRQLGFTIAECAQSNYSRTSHSLTSTFNMEYIQTIKSGIAPDEDPSWLLPYLKHNLVRQQLEGLGYQTIVFKNPWERFVWDDAAIVYKSSGTALLSPFEYLLLRTTVARVYLDVQEAKNSQLADYTNYEDTLYALKQLAKVPDILGPKFVFVHLIIPHSPFVFGPDGEKIDIPYDADAGNIYTWEDDKRGNVAAVSYINKRMLEIIPQLIRDSKTPPIIVLAGDHGTPWGGYQNEVKILAAFFTPGSQSLFYNSITPVNIFRVVFDTYFNGNFGLLPDTSYRFTQEGRFDFEEYPNTCDETD